MYLDKLIDSLTVNLLNKIALNKVNKGERDEFIIKYNKVNYKKIIPTNDCNKLLYLRKYWKYRRIYSSIVIQSNYRAYRVRLKYKNKLPIYNGDHNH